MIDNVKTTTVFTEKELSQLALEISQAPSYPGQRWHNISNIFLYDLNDTEQVNRYTAKIVDTAFKLTTKKYNVYKVFALEYHPGGEAKPHIDTHAQAGGISAITLLCEDNLIGGIAFVVDKLNNATIEISLKVGETLFYNADIVHGVTPVIEGYRHAFVVWLNPE